MVAESNSTTTVSADSLVFITTLRPKTTTAPRSMCLAPFSSSGLSSSAIASESAVFSVLSRIGAGLVEAGDSMVGGASWASAGLSANSTQRANVSGLRIVRTRAPSQAVVGRVTPCAPRPPNAAVLEGGFTVARYLRDGGLVESFSGFIKSLVAESETEPEISGPESQAQRVTKHNGHNTAGEKARSQALKSHDRSAAQGLQGTPESAGGRHRHCELLRCQGRTGIGQFPASE